jgi:hypothetical protein
MSDNPVVYGHLTIYARRVSAARVYEDLLFVQNIGYGPFNPTTGLWIQHCSEVEALAMLQQWEHKVRPPGSPRVPMSEITAAGEKWLAQHET